MSEFLRQKIESEILHEDEVYDESINYLITQKKLEYWMKEFALQVAKEAIQKEVNEYEHRTPEWINAKYHGHYILENIKKRLE